MKQAASIPDRKLSRFEYSSGDNFPLLISQMDTEGFYLHSWAFHPNTGIGALFMPIQQPEELPQPGPIRAR